MDIVAALKCWYLTCYDSMFSRIITLVPRYLSGAWRDDSERWEVDWSCAAVWRHFDGSFRLIIGLDLRVSPRAVRCLHTRHYHLTIDYSTFSIQRTLCTRSPDRYNGDHSTTRRTRRSHPRIARMETESIGISSQWPYSRDERYPQWNKRYFTHPENGTCTSTALVQIGHCQDPPEPP